VFLKADDDTIKKLLIVQEFICFGYPTKKTVVELLRKRGFLKKDGKRVAITNNILIEEILGPNSD
jgi:large subunit ribosomal protein L7e